MNICKKCKHLVYDEMWGEYKCKKLGIRLYAFDKMRTCSGFAKKDKKEQ